MRVDSFTIIIVFFCSITGSTQQTVTDFILKAEKETDYIFNYNSDKTDQHILPFDANLPISLSALRHYFRHTRFDIEVDDKVILVIPEVEKEYQVCGQVISAIELTPLPLANVSINQYGGTFTDEQGYFDHNITGYKNDRITITHLGYEPKVMMVTDLQSCPIIRLDNNENLLAEEIVIRGYLDDKIEEGSSYGVMLVDFNQSEDASISTNEDVLQSLINLPGITNPNDSPADLSIRGSTSDQNLISWEGATLYNSGHLFGMISSINPYSIDEIEVYKTSHGPSYDNRIGGVVDMRLSDRIEEGTQGSVGANTASFHANMSTPIIKDALGVQFGYRKSMYDVFEGGPTFDSYTQKLFQLDRLDEIDEELIEEEEIEPVIDFYDLNAKVNVHLSDLLKVESSYLRTQENNAHFLQLASFSLDNEDDQQVNNEVWSNRISLDLPSEQKIALAYVTSNQSDLSNFQYVNASEELYVTRYNSIGDIQMKATYGREYKSSELELGYNYDRKESLLSEDIVENGTEDYYEINTVGILHHLYYQQNYRKKGFLAEWGVKGSLFTNTATWFFSPSFSVRYRLSDELTIRLQGGRYNQFIRQFYEPLDDELGLENRSWIVDDDPDNGALTANKLALGGVYNRNGWLIDVEAYYHRTTGLAAQNPNVRSPIAFDFENRLVSQGVDFTVSRAFDQFRSSLFYTLSDNNITLNVDEDDEQETIPANNHQKHNLRWQNSIDLNPIQLNVTALYRSGLPYSTPDDVGMDEDDDFELLYESINDEILEPYIRVDLGLKYIPKVGNQNVELGLNVQNVFNKVNIGSRKTFVFEDELMEPEIIEYTQALLPRTFFISLRYWW